MVHGEIQRRVAVVQLVRIHLGAPLNEYLGDMHRVVRRRDVQRALLLRILRLDRRAQVQ